MPNRLIRPPFSQALLKQTCSVHRITWWGEWLSGNILEYYYSKPKFYIVFHNSMLVSIDKAGIRHSVVYSLHVATPLHCRSIYSKILHARLCTFKLQCLHFETDHGDPVTNVTFIIYISLSLSTLCTVQNILPLWGVMIKVQWTGSTMYSYRLCKMNTCSQCWWHTDAITAPWKLNSAKLL